MLKLALPLIVFLLVLPASCASTDRSDGGSPPAVTEPAWYEPEIQAFERSDAADPPEPGRVLFIGSSSIRMWKSLDEDMAPAPVLNRGFGGSRTPEVLAVMDRIVYPYEPSAIVYYCGDNDLGETNTDSRAAADGFIAFAERVHGRWADVPILYLAIKPSLARWKNWEAMERANAMVATYAAAHEHIEFIDVASCLLGPDGTPDPALFLEDGLHLNERGYDRWRGIVRNRLFSVWRKD